MSRGAGDRPLTYRGEWDPTETYIPRDVVMSAGQLFLALRLSVGTDPVGAPDDWAAMGSGDSDHASLGTESVAVGAGAVANTEGVALGVDAGSSFGQAAIAIGYSSGARQYNIAIGNTASANIAYGNSICIGNGSTVTAFNSIAFGDSSDVSGERAIAIGTNADNAVDDRCLIKVNDVELVRSNGTGATSIILADSTGVRWRIGVDTSGNPVGLGAA